MTATLKMPLYAKKWHPGSLAADLQKTTQKSNAIPRIGQYRQRDCRRAGQSRRFCVPMP